MNKIEEFIKEHWDDCVLEGREDGEIRIGLPYPYSIPATEKFDCMYYWDTYFTNLGLLRSGRAMMAKCNVDNMLYLVNKYGFMPNGSRFVFLNRSQPPFLKVGIFVFISLSTEFGCWLLQKIYRYRCTAG